MTTPNGRPHVLFLMSDEHRADVAGFAGNSVIRTPVLDELARTGVVFQNAYTPSPVCIPARQCLASGKLPKTCGCEGWLDLQPGYMTWARRFAQYAYKTTVSGKLHHLGPDQMQGWTRRLAGDITLTSGHIEDRQLEEFKRYERPFRDFKWNDAKEIKRAGIGTGPCVKQDAFAVQGASDYIEEYFNSPYYDREEAAPLLLKVSLLQPHYPYFTSEEKFNYYLNRVPIYLDEPVDHPYLQFHSVRPGVDVSEREIRRATAAYYGMVETIDEQYGRILEALKQVGQDLDDWIIVYTSDHGEMLGQHGQWEKIKFYEGSARVPLIIRWPRRFEARVVEENVNLCDLFATLCDMAGLPTPEGLDSRSLVPLMRGQNAGWDNETISQFGAKSLMIKRDHLKYQYLHYYDTEYPELLFDLERDPEENINFLEDPAYAEVLAGFRQRAGELGHGPEPRAEYVNAGYKADWAAG